MISKEQGKLLLKLARDAIAAHFTQKEPNIAEYKAKFNQPSGVFVTLKKNGELRGCIGYPLPIYPLWQAVMKAAVAAAFQDPRFLPLKEDELNEIKVEVSVLSQPELIKADTPKDFFKQIKIGEHGLIIEYRFNSGLLLPQVATEYNWDAATFLRHLCLKAGLPEYAWKEKGVKIYRFTAQVFSE